MSFINTEKQSLLNGSVAMPKNGVDAVEEISEYCGKMVQTIPESSFMMVPCKLGKAEQKEARKHRILSKIGYIILLFISHEKDEA